MPCPKNESPERAAIVERIRDLQKTLHEMDQKFLDDSLPIVVEAFQAFVARIPPCPTLTDLLAFSRGCHQVDFAIDNNRLAISSAGAEMVSEIVVTIWEEMPDGGRVGLTGRAQTFTDAANLALQRARERIALRNGGRL